MLKYMARRANVRLARFLGAAALLAIASSANAETLKWARRLDVQTLDPYAYNEGTTYTFNQQIYEPLVSRDDNGKLIGVLATEWRMLPDNPDIWEFKLRQNVTFHDGTPFTAKDVVFSIRRAMAPTSNVRTYVNAIESVVAKDADTVQIKTKGPSLLMAENLTAVLIMNEAWAEKNDSAAPQDYMAKKENYAARHENGTGAYRLVSRESDRRTELVAYDKYWGIGQFPLSIDRIIYTPIQSDATRVSALISGQVNFLQDVPPQDVSRLEQNPDLRVVKGPESRTVFLGVNMGEDKLISGNAKGNPFADKRVRQAMNMSIDRQAIQTTIMRGQSIPLGTILSPFASGFTQEMGRVPKYDVAKARQLMMEAGYGDGFSVTLNCTNDGMVSDERICEALVAMLAKIGITVNLDVQPSAAVWPLVLHRKTDFYLMTWGGVNSQILFENLVRSRGTWAGVEFKNPEIDAKIDSLSSEASIEKYNATVAEIWKVVQDECFYLPIHAQMLARAMQNKIHVTSHVGNMIYVKNVKVVK
ncbi:peptide/nickel transport system substrate-binding protein [Bradyrhizobium sp. Rc3b]|uniref:ABC transporter substrate-binding protein n=1 Tax=Bradyrhizobium sp. Rc3b TaxID=1855322 RepID=UPI0008E168C2|nr:ABC transporter substrate-binding protein [Bradyrhizobium sp. Rc3b]SFN92245.1 peptide/nickel transport system substrate-binding protein [Bradyrhizobium sp. Rc3b]